jgi:4'-phosphopantetheinyl transferase EntD
MTIDQTDLGQAVEGLGHALWSIAPAGVTVGARRIDSADVTALFAEEQRAVARAVIRRRDEFATGRALLRSLIGRHLAIAVAANRGPVLPPGVRGSLAHDREFAVAAITRDPLITSIGIDIEPMTALAPGMCPLILRRDERDLDAHLAFTLKEATYKAWSALGGRMLDFHEVRLDIAGSWFQADVVAEHARFHGRFATATGRWVALVVAVDRDQRPHDLRQIDDGRPDEVSSDDGVEGRV